MPDEGGLSACDDLRVELDALRARNDRLKHALNRMTYQMLKMQLKIAAVRHACVYPQNLIGQGETPVFALNAKIILDILDDAPESTE